MLPNPRVEAEENDLTVRNDHFLALGLRPTTLSEGLLTEVREVAARYAHRADPRKIISRSVWRAGMPCAGDLVPVQLCATGRRRGDVFANGHWPGRRPADSGCAAAVG